MVNRLFSCLLVLGLLSFQTGHAKVCSNEYPQSGPIYSGQFAPKATFSNGTKEFGWISYNIHYGEGEIEKLTADIRAMSLLVPLDFIFLQEVNGDATGASNAAESLAKALSLNYVYAPAHLRSGRDHGTAILSRWPLKNPRKVELPPSAFVKCRKRAPIMVEAEVGDAGQTVALYSVHLATWFPDTFVADFQRAKQIAPIWQDVKTLPSSWPVIVAGDLNTVNPLGTAKINHGFSRLGFARLHKKSGPTFKDLPFHLDHAYGRGFTPMEFGTDQLAQGSDHYPIWGTLLLNGSADPE